MHYARLLVRSPSIVLRYFAVVGRAQALRHALTDAERPFEDLRLPVPEWRQRRSDPTFAGPLRALPTLTWDDAFVAETLPIASFLAKRLGHYDGLDDAAIAFREAVASCAYMDIMLRLVEVIRADTHHPGADLQRSLMVALPRVLQKFEHLDACLPKSDYVGGQAPVMTDFFVAETFEALSYVLGPEREAPLQNRLPRSAALATSIRERPALIRVWPRRPTRFTGRPDEDLAIAHLRATNLSTLGF
jgi:glutathione S-transferase